MSVYTKVLDVIGQGQEKEIRGHSNKLQVQYQATVDLENAKQANFSKTMQAVGQFTQIAGRIQEQNRYETAQVEKAQAIEKEEVRYLNADIKERDRWNAEEAYRNKNWELTKQSHIMNQKINEQSLLNSKTAYEQNLAKTSGIIEAYKDKPGFKDDIAKMKIANDSDAKIAAFIEQKQVQLDKDADLAYKEAQKKAQQEQIAQGWSAQKLAKDAQKFNQAVTGIGLADKSTEASNRALEAFNNASKNPSSVYLPKNENEEKAAKAQEPNYKTFQKNAEEASTLNKKMGDMTDALGIGRKNITAITPDDMKNMSDKISSMSKSDPQRQIFEANFSMLAYMNKPAGSGPVSDSDMKMFNASIAGKDIFDTQTWIDVGKDPKLSTVVNKIKGDIFADENMEAFVGGLKNTYKTKIKDAVNNLNATGGFPYNANAKVELAKLALDNPDDAAQLNKIMSLPLSQIADAVKNKTGFAVTLSQEAILKDTYAMNPNEMLKNIPTVIPTLTGSPNADSIIVAKVNQHNDLINSLKKTSGEIEASNQAKIQNQTPPANATKPPPNTSFLNVSSKSGTFGLPPQINPIKRGDGSMLLKDNLNNNATTKAPNNPDPVQSMNSGLNDLLNGG